MKKIIVTIVLFSFSTLLFAQSEKEKTYIKKETKLNTSVKAENQLRAKKLSLETLLPSGMIGGTAYPEEGMNFSPSSNLRAAGDVNKDGFQDFYYSVLVADAGTEDLADRILKTKLFYGSSTGISEENSAFFVDSSSIFKDGLILIDDLTGDDIFRTVHSLFIRMHQEAILPKSNVETY